MKKFALLFSFIFLIYLVQPVFSDGCIVVPKPKEWQLHDEERQLAAIHFEDGKQNMILAIDAGEIKEEQAVWIFPVPSQPEEVELDIVEGFPEYFGSDLEEEKNKAVGEMFIVLFASQPYFWPFAILMSVMNGMVTGNVASINGLDYSEKGFQGVTVHEHIEKHGLTSELITAKESGQFYDYLYSKDLKLPVFVENTFNEYIGEDYSFVVSWVSDANELTKKQSLPQEDYYYNYYYDEPTRYPLGIFVSFPTEKMFFPLKPTSVYGEKTVPVLLYVSNYVTPEIPSNLKNLTSIKYFIDDYYGKTSTEDNSVKKFFNGKDSLEKFKYTKINIESKAENFTEDLWINSAVPEKALFYESIINNFWFYTLIFFILLSCLASVFAAKIVFRENNPDLLMFALFGLTNFLTLLGFAVLAYFLKIDKRFTSIKKDSAKKISNNQIFISTLKFSTLFAGLLVSPFVLILISSIFSASSVFVMFFSILCCFFGILLLFFFLLLLPFSWLYYKNRKLLKFTGVFTFIFFILIIISLIILPILLA